MPGEKKELIREAAVKVIASEGFFNATTDLIATEAGVSVGTIYNYFKNKQDILGYIFEVELTKRIEFWENIEPDNSIREKLMDYIKFHFREISRNLDLANVLVREHNFPTKHVIEPVEHFKEKIINLLVEMLQEGKTRGEVNSFQNLKVTAAAVFGALQGSTQQYIKLLEENEEIKASSQISREVFDVIWHSIKVRN